MIGMSRARCVVPRVAVLVLFVMAGTPVEAHAQSAEQLYRQGISAKNAGDFRTAAARFERATRLAPRDADILTQLGLIYAFQSRYREAQGVLERAVRLAPRNADAILALARVKAWQSDFAGAQREVDRVLALAPGDFDAKAFDARLAMSRRDFAGAQRKYEALAKEHPGNTEVLIGLGDARAESGDQKRAREAYEAAIKVDPQSSLARTRLAAPPKPARLRWHLSSSVSFSTFARQRREPWYETFHQATHFPTESIAVHGRIEISHRFRKTDTYLQGGVDARVMPWLTAYLHLGGTPGANFREQVAVLGGGSIRLLQGGHWLGGSLAVVDAKYTRYRTGPVRTVAPGIQQYFAGGRIWLTAKWINTIAEDDRYRVGWSVRADGMVTDRLRTFAGASAAPETSENITIDTRSYFGGVIFDWTETVAVGIDYLYEDRRGSYVRSATTATLRIRF